MKFVLKVDKYDYTYVLTKIKKFLMPSEYALLNGTKQLWKITAKNCRFEGYALRVQAEIVTDIIN